MTYNRRHWQFWHVVPGTAVVAALAMVGGFLAPSISPASATTTTATTITTTLVGPAVTALTARAAVPGS